MEAARQEAGCGGGDEKICRRRNDGKIVNCMNISGDNKIQYCDKHYKDFIDFYTENPSLITANKSKCLPKKKLEEIEFLKKNKLPLPDEHLCRHNNGSWRCKKLRMGHDAADDDHTVLKAKVCEKHYYYYRKNNKKRSRDGDGAAATGSIEETRDSNFSLGIQPATTDIEGGSANVGAKRKKVQGAERSWELDFADLLIQKPSFITSNEMKEEMEKKKLPTNEQFCCLTNGMGWKCEKFRMSYGAAADDTSVPNTKFCDKHYNYYSSYNKNYYKKKKTIGDGEGAGAGRTTATGPVEEAYCSKLTEEDDDDEEIQKLGATGHNTSDRIGRKRESVESAEKSGEPESFKGIGETVVELESLEHYKTKCFQLSVELEKKKVECTTLQGKLAEVKETRKTSTTDGTKRTPADAFECWRKMFSDLAESMESRLVDVENIVMRMDNKVSTMEGCVESRISKLESLVPKSGKGGSILRCVQLCHSEKIESGAQGSQKDATQSGEKLRDENNRKDSDLYDGEIKEKVLNVYDAGSLRVSSDGENVEERKGWGCSEERPSQHGSLSQNHLEMSTEPFVNLVSDDDSVEILGDSDCSTDSEHSLGTLMDMLEMKYRNRNEDKDIKWKCEADMLSSFEKGPDLCMKAVCALYRQQISEEEISDKGLLQNSDALRCTTLAKLLMDEDCEGDLNKSVEELEIFDSNAVDDCKRLARRYSTQLFSIYQNGKDPFFLPSTAASHGDETAK